MFLHNLHSTQLAFQGISFSLFIAQRHAHFLIHHFRRIILVDHQFCSFHFFQSRFSTFILSLILSLFCSSRGITILSKVEIYNGRGIKKKAHSNTLPTHFRIHHSLMDMTLIALLNFSSLLYYFWLYDFNLRLRRIVHQK